MALKLKDALDILNIIITLKGQAKQIINQEEDDAKRKEYWKECENALEIGNTDNVRKLLFD